MDERVGGTSSGQSLDWTCEELAAGLQAYRDGDFFEAHERWETVWRRSREPAKTLLQAFIQVAAALHHANRGNRRGATTLFRGALEKLEPYDACFGALSVETFRDGIRDWLCVLEAEDGRPWPPPPGVTFVA